MTAPEVTMNSESPGSPWWNRTSLRPEPPRAQAGRQPLERARSSPANSWTRSSASTADPAPSISAWYMGRCRQTDRLRVGAAVAGAAWLLADTRPRDLPLPRPCGVGPLSRATDRPRLRAGLAAARYACVRTPRRVRRDRDPARLRAGRGRRPGRPDRAGPAQRGHRRAHARRPLHRPPALRYRFAWGERMTAERLPVLLPPGGAGPVRRALAGVVSERDGFFDDAFEIREYDPAAPTGIGGIDVGYVPGLHYVPAWGVVAGRRRRDADRLRRRHRTESRAGGAGADAELLVCEATLGRADEDDPGSRGHLSLDEAIEHAGPPGRARPDHPLPVGTTSGNARAPGRPVGRAGGPGPARARGRRCHRGRCRRRATAGRPDRPREATPWRPHGPGGRTSDD